MVDGLSASVTGLVREIFAMFDVEQARKKPRDLYSQLGVAFALTSLHVVGHDSGLGVRMVFRDRGSIDAIPIGVYGPVTTDVLCGIETEKASVGSRAIYLRASWRATTHGIFKR